MIRFLPTALTTILLLVTPIPTPDRPGDDQQKLQGAWNIVSVEIDNQPLAMESLIDSKLVIRGDKYSFTLAETRLEFTFRVDPAAKPKAIDLTVMEGAEKGLVYHGIYKLEGNTYTICRTTEPGKPRPTAFATEKGAGFMIVVWKQARR